MRKLMNKKGFSLVELMIVVVIMGILVAVAIPLYGAIQSNAKNKTCKNNIVAIRSNATNYYASNGVTPTLDNLKNTFDDNNLPVCPWDNQSYSVTIDAEGAATVRHLGAAHAENAEGCAQNVTNGPNAKQ